MEMKEAIRRVEDHFRVHDDGRPTPFLDEAVRMVLTAAKLHIPNNPIERRNRLRTTGGYDYYCPTCGACIGVANKYKQMLSRQTRCKCGQLIDWSEVE